VLLLSGCGGGGGGGGRGDTDDPRGGSDDPETYLADLPAKHEYAPLAPADEQQARARFGPALGSAQQVVIRQVVKNDATQAVVVVVKMRSAADVTRLERSFVKSAGGTPRRVVLDDREAMAVENPAYGAIYDSDDAIFLAVLSANPREGERIAKRLVI
jgi:hypothetical protein